VYIETVLPDKRRKARFSGVFRPGAIRVFRHSIIFYNRSRAMRRYFIASAAVAVLFAVLPPVFSAA